MQDDDLRNSGSASDDLRDGAHSEVYNPERDDVPYTASEELLDKQKRQIGRLYRENQRLQEAFDETDRDARNREVEQAERDRDYARRDRWRWIGFAAFGAVMVASLIFAFNQSSQRAEAEATARGDNSSQEHAIQDMENERDSAISERNQIQSQLDSTRQQLDDKTKELDDLKKDTKSRDKDFKKKEDEINDLKDRLKDAEKAAGKSSSTTATVTVTETPEADDFD